MFPFLCVKVPSDKVRKLPKEKAGIRQKSKHARGIPCVVLWPLVSSTVK
jgi:hypothetical protein